jgi:hypothetical protein
MSGFFCRARIPGPTFLGYPDEELAIAPLNGMAHIDLPAIGSGLQRLAGNLYLGVTDRGVALARTCPRPVEYFHCCSGVS